MDVSDESASMNLPRFTAWANAKKGNWELRQNNFGQAVKPFINLMTEVPSITEPKALWYGSSFYEL